MIAIALLASFGGSAIAADFEADALHANFMDAFNNRQWEDVERGDFAMTAGADDSSCYAGSYMMTWAPQDGDSWRLQWLAWQDLETDLANCR